MKSKRTIALDSEQNCIHLRQTLYDTRPVYPGASHHISACRTHTTRTHFFCIHSRCMCVHSSAQLLEILASDNVTPCSQCVHSHLQLWIQSTFTVMNKRGKGKIVVPSGSIGYAAWYCSLQRLANRFRSSAAMAASTGPISDPVTHCHTGSSACSSCTCAALQAG